CWSPLRDGSSVALDAADGAEEGGGDEAAVGVEDERAAAVCVPRPQAVALDPAGLGLDQDDEVLVEVGDHALVFLSSVPAVAGEVLVRAERFFAVCFAQRRPARTTPSARVAIPKASHCASTGQDEQPAIARSIAAGWSEVQSRPCPSATQGRSEEHTSELQSRFDLVCR